jgi:hypothetical protein
MILQGVHVNIRDRVVKLSSGTVEGQLHGWSAIVIIFEEGLDRGFPLSKRNKVVVPFHV